MFLCINLNSFGGIVKYGNFHDSEQSIIDYNINQTRQMQLHASLGWFQQQIKFVSAPPPRWLYKTQMRFSIKILGDYMYYVNNVLIYLIDSVAPSQC